VQDFEIVDDQVRCPACHRLGTVQIPTQEKLTQCKACKAIFRRTRWGRFKWKAGCQLEPERLRAENGFPYLKLETPARLIFLKDKEVLHVRQKRSGLPYFSIVGRGGAFYYPEEVYEVVLAGGQIGSGRELLEKYHIPIIRLSEAELASLTRKREVARRLRDALSRLEGGSRLQKAGDLIVAKILSNIYYTQQFVELLPRTRLTRTKVEDLVLRQFDHLLQVLLLLEEWQELQEQLEIASALASLFRGLSRGSKRTPFESTKLLAYSERIYLAKLRSQEGNAERAAWEAVKQVLPTPFQFSSRQAQRLVRTDLYWGPKARDPFNCALNFLYFLLGTKVSEALAKARFNRYWPGPGIVHSRRQVRARTSRQWVERRENREFLYDFMDTYRAPFRFHLTLAFRQAPDLASHPVEKTALGQWHRTHQFTKQDFYYELDEWHERVYFPTETGERKLRALFALICSHHFEQGGTKKMLTQWMEEEASSFASFLLGEDNEHTPFLAFEDAQQAASLLHYFQSLAQFVGYSKFQSDQREFPELLPLAPTPPPSVMVSDTRPMNLIIITHNDFDGFASALLLLLKYSWIVATKQPVYILIGENAPDHPQHFWNLLETRVPPLLWKRASNIVVVADFPLTKWREAYLQLRWHYLGLLPKKREQLSFLWYDHHSQSNFDPTFFSDYTEIELHYTPDETKHVFCMLWEELRRTPPKKGVNPYWEFFKQLTLTETNWLSKEGDPFYLNKWFARFRQLYANPAGRPKNWVHFFKTICRGTSPPEVAPPSATHPLVHGSLHRTADGKTFATLVFREYFEINHVKELLQTYLQQQLPDFVLCYWANHTISLRSFSQGTVNFMGLLKAQGLGGHPGAGAIVLPRRKAYHCGAIDLYSLLTVDEFVEWLSKSVLTRDPHTLYGDSVQHIPPSEMASWEHRWESEALQRATLQTTYGYKTTIAYMPEYQAKIQATLAKLTTPFISSATTDPSTFEAHTTMLKIEFPSGTSLSFPANDVCLLFTDWQNKNSLVRFLHYVIVEFHRQVLLHAPTNPPVVLYIDTLRSTLSLKKLITLSAPLSLLKTLFFTQIPTYSLLYSFITQYLKSFITQVRQETSKAGRNPVQFLVVINTPFELISSSAPLPRHNRTQPQQPPQSARRGAELVRRLRTLARELNVTILLTSIGATLDSRGRHLVPSLFRRVRHALKYQLFIQIKRQHFKLQQLANNQWNYCKIPCPPLKLTKEMDLAEFCSLPGGIDFTMPER